MSKVINISDAASIAIHSLAVIAGSEDRINAIEISRITSFSKNHLSKILLILNKHSYINSERGPSGGFIMKKDPKKITLLEIYELIDGKFEIKYCRLHNNHTCVFGCITKKLTGELVEYLKSKTIHDIIINPKTYEKKNCKN